jgi:predicted nucleic acid-binding protein
VNLYAESSAVLSWLLGEPAGESVLGLLERADIVVTSELTLVECDRALIRARSMGALSEAERMDRRAALNNAAAGWHILTLATEILDRAREPFPGKLLRTLDALHIASLLAARAGVPGLALLTFHHGLGAVARQLGFACVPGALPIGG